MIYRPRIANTLALLGLLLGGLLLPAPRPVAAQAEACFAETGFCVRGRLLDYWQTNGGLARNGYPLSEEQQELLEDGQTYTVQYFERVRLELHPENAAPYDVLLGQFGRRVLRRAPGRIQQNTAPATPIADQAYFAETGHNVGGRFLAYWQANGGLAQFGYPLTEEVEEQLEDGNIYRVQYFERARLEDHQENAAPYDVLLGQFGRTILAESDLLAGDRGFAALYLTNERVQALLAYPTASVERGPGAYQAFERGVMLSRGDQRRIYALCGVDQPGEVILSGTPPRNLRPSFADTWREGEPVGGGPRADLYEPRYGFGKVWREASGTVLFRSSASTCPPSGSSRVRDYLGYATSPEETYYTIREQQFAGGWIYALRYYACGALHLRGVYRGNELHLRTLP